MKRKQIPEERLFELNNKIKFVSPSERKRLIEELADFYGVSATTVYRNLRQQNRPRSLNRSDAGLPRKISTSEMEKYCQIIAAMKVRTSNKKGRHLSTSECIRLLEEYGIETPHGLIKAPKSLLTKPTVNRYLKKWGYHLPALSIEPVSVRFQAEYSNDCWHFDLSYSDLKDMDEWPPWIEHKKGRPLLMLYGVVDDRSGAAYYEYHVVYGEDVESALKFLYKAMSPKNKDNFPFQGIPKMIYMDNGPISKSQLFRRVMDYLKIEPRVHMPQGKDGRRTTARSKGKVERPFRTVKEVHETLYHFHQPKNVQEANEWLMNYLLRYNDNKHRSEPHSRMEDWVENVPPGGIQKVCSWERFCTFAREPEQRKVGPDARISVNGTAYEVNHELADQDVTLWWGLFDNNLYVELGDQKFGPYSPVSGPIPLHRYRSFKKTAAEKRADLIEKLAQELHLPKEALNNEPQIPKMLLNKELPLSEFHDPDPFHEIYFPSALEAKKAISSSIGLPLAKLTDKDREIIDSILDKTMEKTKVLSRVKDYLNSKGDQS
jgi:hypothetical protein